MTIRSLSNKHVRSSNPLRPELLLIALLALGPACGGSGGAGKKDSGATDAGSGGSSGGGGSGGGGSGGSGSGGAPGGTGGTGSGGAGGTATGGTGGGGSSGSGGGGGSGGSGTGGTGGAKDGGGTDGGSGDGGGKDSSDTTEGGSKDGGDAGSSLTLDACFEGLPAPVGTHMLATKRSADGRVRVRVALDSLGMLGTSGSKPWTLIRLGVEIDGVVTCVTARSNLTYMGTHHNCLDTAFATAGTLRFDFAALDRSTAQMTVRQGTTVTLGPVTITDTTCRQVSGPTVLPQCSSGGPC